MKRLFGTFIIAGLVLITATACQPDARQELVATSVSPVGLRSIQTRVFDTADRARTLTAVVETLQDLQFLVDRADASLGVVTATKVKKRTQLRMSVTIHPSGSNRTSVRANGQFNQNAVDDPRFYQFFFAALERSLFLNAHDGGALSGVSSRPFENAAAVPTMTETASFALPFDGVWVLEIGVVKGGRTKDRVLTVVTNGRFQANFETDGWRGQLQGEIDASGMLSANGALKKMQRDGTGSLRFDTPYRGDGFRKTVLAKARSGELFEVSLTR